MLLVLGEDEDDLGENKPTNEGCQSYIGMRNHYISILGLPNTFYRAIMTSQLEATSNSTDIW